MLTAIRKGSEKLGRVTFTQNCPEREMLGIHTYKWRDIPLVGLHAGGEACNLISLPSSNQKELFDSSCLQNRRPLAENDVQAKKGIGSTTNLLPFRLAERGEGLYTCGPTQAWLLPYEGHRGVCRALKFY